MFFDPLMAQRNADFVNAGGTEGFRLGVGVRLAFGVCGDRFGGTPPFAPLKGRALRKSMHRGLEKVLWNAGTVVGFWSGPWWL